MAITDLIAQGGTNVPSPVDRYIQGRDFVGQQRARQQEAQLRQQQMGLRQQKAEIQQQEEMRARGEEYAKTIAPVLAEITQLPEGQRQNAYQQALPKFKQEAQRFGLPVDNLSPTWDDQKAKMIVDRYWEPPQGKFVNAELDGKTVPAIETQEGVLIDPETKEPLVGAIKAPTRQMQGTPKDFDLTKKSQNKLQEEIIRVDEFLERSTDLKELVQELPDGAFTWGADLGVGTLKALSRTFGINYEGDIQEFMKKKDNVGTFTRMIRDSYRRMITGSQANKTELKNIEQQMPNEKDTKQTLLNKIEALNNIAEKSQVRSTILSQMGFQFKGRDDDDNLVYEKDGEEFKYEDLGSIGNIRSHEEQREYLYDLYKQNPVDEQGRELSERELAMKVLSKMKSMGYNMRRYKAFQ